MDIDKNSVEMKDKIQKPSKIYVKPFSPGTNWEGDLENKSKENFIAEKTQELSSRMVKSLSEVAPTEMAPEKLPSKGLMVTGEILHVDAGSGPARALVGFGAGAREVTAQIRIFDLSKSSKNAIAVFKIEGGSRGDPGIWEAVSGLTNEFDRIAKQTRDFLIQNIEH
jgi:hypothetical protein